jgi:protein-disulfide isomerase
MCEDDTNHCELAENRMRVAILQRNLGRKARISTAISSVTTVVIIVIVILVLLVGYEVAISSSLRQSSFTSNTQSSTMTVTSTDSRLVYLTYNTSFPLLGNKSAPVTIYQFGDFQCTTCDAWFKTQEDQVIQNLVNTSKAKLVWRDFDYYGPDSKLASQAAYAAGEQGKFWQFYDTLYTNQETPNNGWANQTNLINFARALRLNMAQFNQSFASGKFDSLINANYKAGQSLGITGTPTFFLVGPKDQVVQIVGDQPASVFETEVNSMISS